MQFNKLTEAIRESRKVTEYHRNNYRKDVGQYAGPRHSTSRDIVLSEEVDPELGNTTVNLLELAISIMTAKLISGRPACTASTNQQELKPTARFFALALNRVMDLINVRETLELAVNDAMFGMGVVKVGITLDDSDVYGSDWHYTALPFVDHIEFPDYFYDAFARRWDLIRFEGNYFVQHIDDIRNDPRNDPEVVKQISPDNGASIFSDPHDFSDSSDSGFNGGFLKDRDNEMVTLASVYVVREKKIYTYVPGIDDRPLRVQDWVGPKGGPYRKLWFNRVPQSLMPLPPSQKAAPLAKLLGNVWDKMGMQASRQKTVYAANIQSTGADDADAVKYAADGDIINVRDPNSVKPMPFPGVPQESIVFAGQARDIFSYIWGNLDSVGGLGASAPTATQEQLLSASANGMVQTMQQKVVNFVRSVFESMGWYIWNDPDCRIRVLDRISGTNMQLTINWPHRSSDVPGQTYDDREGKDLKDIALEITPYSLQDISPAQKNAAITQTMVQEILPTAQLMGAQGLVPDFQAYYQLKEDLTGIDYSEILKSQTPVEEPNTDLGVKKPPNTTRTYERVRGGGPSRSGAERAMMMGMKRK